MRQKQFVASDETLVFVVLGFEAFNRVTADNSAREKLRDTITQGLEGLCFSLGRALAHAKRAGQRSLTESILLTKVNGGFTEDVLASLTARMHCQAKDKDSFGEALFKDFTKFLREIGGRYVIIDDIFVELINNDICVNAAPAPPEVRPRDWVRAKPIKIRPQR